MRALLTPDATLGDAPEPQPLSNQALVRTHAISLNRGDVRALSTLEPQTVAGWDFAGIVEQAAADGTGPAEGERVVGMVTSGGWAERVATPTRALATLPDDVTFEQAAALPVAGLTALKALDVAGSVIGRRMLITGASGGVGRFAIQLAKLAGAHVTAVARRTEGLRELGADDVRDQVEGDRYDVILDAIGGATFGRCVQHLAPEGTLVCIAATDEAPASFHPRDLYNQATGARIYGLMIFDEHDGPRDFARLLALVADGRVDPQIDRIESWHDAPREIEALMNRQVSGKVVLRVD